MENRKKKALIKKQNNDIENLRRAKYFVIFSPPRFINPFKSYVINPFFVLTEKKNTIIASLGALSNLKKIDTVKVNYPEEGDITFIFSQAQILTDVSPEYVIARLKSFSDIESNQWAILIENYRINYQNSFQNIKNALESKNFVPETNTQFLLDDRDKKIKYFKGKSYWMNIIYSPSEIIYDSIVYRKELINFKGYDVDYFIKTALTHGLPRIFIFQEDYFTEIRKKAFKKLFCFEFNTFEFKNKIVNIENFTGVSRVSGVSGVLCQKTDDTNILAQHFVNLSIDDEEAQKSVVEEVVDEKPYYENKPDTEKELHEFLEKFYTPKIIPEPLENEMNKSRRCKIKIITDDEKIKFTKSIDEKLLAKNFSNFSSLRLNQKTALNLLEKSKKLKK